MKKIYKDSYKSYDKEAEKLEKKGVTEHLKANLQFRKTLTRNVNSSFGTPTFEKKLDDYTRHASQIILLNEGSLKETT